MALKVDFHVHTDASFDGRSGLETLAKQARVRGLDAIAVCDHNQYAEKLPSSLYGLHILPGCELSTDRGHVLALFCETPIDRSKLLPAGVLSVAAAVQEIHRCGGIAVLAHPFQNPNARFDDIAPCFDAIETQNARAVFKNRAANEQAESFAARFSLPALGGSDAHSELEVGNAYTLVEADSVEALKSAVLSGRAQAVFVRRTPGVYKGLSRLTAARRSGGFRKICKALIYLPYSILRDII